MLDQALQLQQRAKQFALRIVSLFRRLPRTEEARIIGRQVLRSGTSLAANYRAACRSRSHPEFVAKLGVVVEEMDETLFWLELLVEAGIIGAGQMQELLKEGAELLSIFSASHHTARARTGRSGRKSRGAAGS
jgi:four helix bundle protein